MVNWLFGQKTADPERLSFKDLVKHPGGTTYSHYHEFHRRTRHFVFAAARDYKARAAAPQSVEVIVSDVYLGFAGVFQNCDRLGDGDFVLRRFAEYVDRHLDSKAMVLLLPDYYLLLPLYYLKSAEQIQYWLAASKEGLSGTPKKSLAEIVAEKMSTTEKRAAKILSAANAALADAIKDKFKVDELRVLTAGYLPP